MLDAPPNPRTILHHFGRRLSEFDAPFAKSLALLDVSAGEPVSHSRGLDITPQLAGAPRIVTSGWACYMRPHESRRRQIFGFLLPGDVIGSFWRRPEYAFWRLSALTRLSTVSVEGLLAAGPDGRFAYPEIVKAARRAEDHAHHLLVDHIVRLGARDAYAGLAHLLLELHARLGRVGLARDDVFPLPIGQRVLAQTLGFSVAHTNHTLQRMTADGLFVVEGEVVRLLQPDRMAALAQFAVSDPKAMMLDSSSVKGLQHEPEVHHHNQGR
ncbi:helix-turn-helix domain-containing protein [Caulobacter sp. S45]|uniref:helix-turn-helix domain-containing protein n=1 Tax=Caulobacter sp. S45 TaxID=1641861 RepID=UPI0015750DB3|nr:helix-turn-helix domain-containing protein [Caulobacter sp. S45]